MMKLYQWQSRYLRKYRIFLLVLLLLVPVSVKAVELEGMATNSEGSRITTATIEIMGEEFVKRVKTIDEGTFKIDLPAGKYRVKATAVGFCPMSRAPIEISPDSTKVVINFTLVECALAYIIPVDGSSKEGVDEYKLPFQEDFIESNRGDKQNYSFLVQFGKKSTSGNKVNYYGFKLDNKKFIGVIMTYGSTRIRAARIEIDLKKLAIEAVGNVVLERNGEVTEADNILLDIKSGKFQTNL